MQKDANLVELEKGCQTHIFLQNFVLIQPRTSPPKICKILKKLPILLTLNPHGAKTGTSSPGREPAAAGVFPRTRRLRREVREAQRVERAQGRPRFRHRLGYQDTDFLNGSSATLSRKYHSTVQQLNKISQMDCQYQSKQNLWKAANYSENP